MIEPEISKSLSQEIETERKQRVKEAMEQYSRRIKELKTAEEREKRHQQLQQELAEIKALSDIKKVEAGILKYTIIPTTTGEEIKVTPETAMEIKEEITGEGYKKKVAESIAKGEKVEFTPEGVKIYEEIPITTPKEEITIPERRAWAKEVAPPKTIAIPFILGKKGVEKVIPEAKKIIVPVGEFIKKIPSKIPKEVKEVLKVSPTFITPSPTIKPTFLLKHAERGLIKYAKTTPTIVPRIPITKESILTPEKIDIAKIMGDILATREIEWEKEEKIRKEILPSLKKIEKAKTYEKQQEIIEKLKSKGVKVGTAKTAEGEIYYTFNIPDVIELRPSFETKTVKEPVISFFLRKLRRGVEEPTAKVYQKAVFKTPEITEEAKIAGKIAGIGATVGMYALPYVGTAMFLGPTAEKIMTGPKEFLQFAKEEPIEVGVAATYGVLKGVQYARQPVTYRIGKPKPLKIEAVQKIKTGAKYPIAKAEFAMRIKRPAVKYAIQPRWKTWFGIKPKPSELRYIKAQTYMVATGEPILMVKGRVIGQPTIYTVRKGAKYITLSKLRAGSKPITKAYWSKLTKLEKWQLKKSVTKFYKLKKEISDKKLYELLRGKEISIGEAEVTKVVRLAEKKIKIFPYGKRITRAKTVSIMKRKGAIYQIDTEIGIARYKGITIAKEVTYPFARAGGKPKAIKELTEVKGLIRLEEFAPTRAELGFIPPAKITKTSWAKTFQISKGVKTIGTLGAVEFAAAKAIPKITLPTVKPPMQISRAALTLKVGEKVKVVPKEQVKVIPKVLPKTIPKIIPKITPEVTFKIIPKEQAKVIPKTISKPIPKIIPKVVPKVTPEVAPKTILKTIPEIPIAPITKMAITKKEEIKPKKITFFQKIVKTYIAQVKRKGRWFAVSKPMIKALAIKKGAEIVRKTLAASFKIVPTKKTIKIIKKVPEYIPSPKIFRTYKIRKGRKIPLTEEWIQKREFRLSHPQEVREIIQAKRKTSRKIKFKRKKGGKKIRWL